MPPFPVPRPAAARALAAAAVERSPGSLLLPSTRTLGGVGELPQLGPRPVPVIDERALGVATFVDALKNRRYRPPGL